MTLLHVALSCIARGWHVFPCKPKTKEPAIKGGVLSASNDEKQIRAWWDRWPHANVAIATAPSGLCVLDCDHGLGDEEGFHAWAAFHHFPATYTVRTGRRDDFGVQLYFEGDGVKSIGWDEGAHSGDIRCSSGYVMAAGSVHPDSGETYEVIVDARLAPMPGYVSHLKSVARGVAGGHNAPVVDGGGPIDSHRNTTMISLLGRRRGEGADDDELRAYAVEVNDTRMVPPLSEDELERLITNACKFPVPGPEPLILLGGKFAGEPQPKESVDWRTRYMSMEAFESVKPPTFLIDGFLVKGSITMLGGPVAQRKSIIALNVAHALCTGEPLFGYFDVPGGQERVVYLCPEMGAASFVKRIKQIGLGEFIGKTLFVQTMNEQQTALDELDGELPGAVVIVDTIVRFVEGDENKSEDMRRFAQRVFRLVNAGATVVLLHHSKKGSAGTLDDGLRGSSELAAFVDSCWVTELEDPKKPYESLSKVRNVKQRDFESDPFKLKPTEGSYYLAMEGEPEPEAVLKSKADDAATELLRTLLAENPRMGVNKLCSSLRSAGQGRGARWVTMARASIVGGGVVVTE